MTATAYPPAAEDAANEAIRASLSYQHDASAENATALTSAVAAVEAMPAELRASTVMLLAAIAARQARTVVALEERRPRGPATRRPSNRAKLRR